MSITLSFVLGLLLWPFTSCLAENAVESSKIEIPSEIVEFLGKPAVLPDSSWYFIKRIKEKLGDWFSIRKITEYKRNSDLAKERLAEAYALIDEGKIEKAKIAMYEFRKRLDLAGGYLEKLKQTKGGEELINGFTENTEKFNIFFGKLLESLPLSEQDEFKEAFKSSDKWLTLARSFKIEAQKKLDQVKDNIYNAGKIKEEVEKELEKK